MVLGEGSFSAIRVLSFSIGRLRGRKSIALSSLELVWLLLFVGVTSVVGKAARRLSSIAVVGEAVADYEVFSSISIGVGGSFGA